MLSDFDKADDIGKNNIFYSEGHDVIISNCTIANSFFLQKGSLEVANYPCFRIFSEFVNVTLNVHNIIVSTVKQYQAKNVTHNT